MIIAFQAFGVFATLQENPSLSIFLLAPESLELPLFLSTGEVISSTFTSYLGYSLKKGKNRKDKWKKIIQCTASQWTYVVIPFLPQTLNESEWLRGKSKTKCIFDFVNCSIILKLQSFYLYIGTEFIFIITHIENNLQIRKSKKKLLLLSKFSLVNGKTVDVAELKEVNTNENSEH